jgi:integrase/recombinase XerD
MTDDTPALPTEAARWIATFLEAQAAENDAARNTRLAYGRDLADFALWLDRCGLALATTGKEDVVAYLVFCEAQGLARATRARRLSSVRQMFRFAYEEGWRKDDPALQLKGPGRAQRLPMTMTVDQVTALLQSAIDIARDAPERARNRALFEVLYATGMRVSELVELPVAAVRGDPQMLLVRGKGGKERMVPLSPPARAALADWLIHRDAAEAVARAAGKPPSRHLFPGRGAAGHLTRQQFFLMVKQAARHAGLDAGQVTPHVLRHAFATHLLANGADLRVIQTFLGHADLSTTEIYTHVLDDHLKSLVFDHHPLARRTSDDTSST